MNKFFTLLVLISFSLFLTMCDDGVTSKKSNVKVTATGLWLDTIPIMIGMTTSPIEIKFDLRNDDSSGYDIIMQETDTKKKMFIHSGTWTEDDDSVYVTGSECQVLEKEGDTLTDNESLCGTPIGIPKEDINISNSPDTWELALNEISFLLEGLDLSDFIGIIGNTTITLNRND